MRSVGLVFVFISAAAGGFLVALAIRNLLRGAASRRWSRVEGRILRSFVLVHADGDGEGFTPEVEYEYAIGGNTYRGKQIRYGQIGAGRRKRAEQVIAPFQAGSGVPVFVNPEKPAESVLLPGTSLGNAVIALAGAVFLAAAWLMLFHPK